LFTECAFPTWLTNTHASKALAVSRAVWNLAVVLWDVTLRTFPALLAVTQSTTILSMVRAQNRADTWANHKEYSSKQVQA